MIRSYNNRILFSTLIAGLILSVSGLRLSADVWDDVATPMKAGDFAEALERLQAEVQTDPDNYHLHRIMGVCAMKQGRLVDAAQYFRSAIRLQADSSAARYELARVLALQGHIGEAEALLREVIDLAPGSSYAARAEKVLPGLEKLKQTLLVRDEPSRLDLYVRVAGEHDDNVPARSKHDSGDGTDSLRLTSSLHVGYRFPDQQIDPAWPTLEMGYSLYRSFYEDREFEDYEVMSHRLRVELSRTGRVIGHWVEAGVEGTYSNTDLGEDPFSDDVGVDAHVSIQMCSAFLATLGYGMHWKDFDDDTAYPDTFSRDGSEQELTVTTYTYLLENRLIAGLGYGYLWNDVDGTQFELNRHQVTGSATMALPNKLRLYTSVTYANEDYDVFTPDPKREDDVYSLYASLSRPLWHEDWRAELSATHNTSDSSRDFAEYDRTVYGVAVSWSP